MLGTSNRNMDERVFILTVVPEQAKLVKTISLEVVQMIFYYGMH
jgi:hypothetical protein